MQFGLLSIALPLAVLAQPHLAAPEDDPNDSSQGLLRREQASLIDNADSPESDEDPSVDAQEKLMSASKKFSAMQTAQTSGLEDKNPSEVAQTAGLSSISESSNPDESGAAVQQASDSDHMDAYARQQAAIGEPDLSGIPNQQTAYASQPDASYQPVPSPAQNDAYSDQQAALDQTLVSNQQATDFNQGDISNSGSLQPKMQEVQEPANGLEETGGQQKYYDAGSTSETSAKMQETDGQQQYYYPQQNSRHQRFGQQQQQFGQQQQQYGQQPYGQQQYGQQRNGQHQHHQHNGKHQHNQHGASHGGYSHVPNTFPSAGNEPEYENINWDKMREWPYAGPFGGTGRRRRSTVAVSGIPTPFREVYPQYPLDWTGHVSPSPDGSTRGSTLDMDMNTMMNYYNAKPSHLR